MGIPNQNPINPCIFTRLGINYFVTYHIRVLRVHVVLRDEFLNHLAGRFAAMTIVIRGMRTNSKVLKGLKLMQAHIILKLAMNDINRFKGKITTTDARLISDYKKLIA